MTTACAITLGISLAFYLAATLLFQGSFLLRKTGWEHSGRRSLLLGVSVHSLGMILHALLSGQSPFSNMLIIISWLIIALLGAALLAEHYTQVRYLSLLAAPLAFLGLLYPILMPVRFAGSQSVLLQYPWLGVHVVLTLLGHVGLALAFCTAAAYLMQQRFLKKGRLNRYLPALDSSAAATFRFAGAGFFFFTLGLGMGLIWFFGAPGEYLQGRDTKIWMAIPSWLTFAFYLYRRGINRQHGSRLKWVVIVGFLLALANLVGVRHNFSGAPQEGGTELGASLWHAPSSTFDAKHSHTI
jgi:ABC-type transport system involved in cytochrome c biogenesis permease subunit